MSLIGSTMCGGCSLSVSHNHEAVALMAAVTIIKRVAAVAVWNQWSGRRQQVPW